jgi:nitroreductase
MEFDDVIRRRRMVRTFQDRPVPAETVDRLLDHARRAPSAGYSQGSAFLVLEGASQTEEFWKVTSLVDQPPPGSRFERLRGAPVIVVPLAHRQTYLDRYAEPDKARSSLADADAWSVPYWLVDTAFATMNLLLSAANEGLGALFFGIPQRSQELLAELDVPAGYESIGAVALGWPAPDTPSPSLARGRRALAEVVHRGRW